MENTRRAIAVAVSYDQPKVHQISYSDFISSSNWACSGPTRWAQPDRFAKIVHLLPELGKILRPIDRLARHIGVDLDTERAELVDRPLGFGNTGIRCVERYLRDPARKMITLLRTQLRKAIIDDANEFVDLRGLSEALDRRLWVSQDLRIILVAINDLLAGIKIVERRDRPHALADVFVLTGYLQHLVKEFLGRKWV